MSLFQSNAAAPRRALILSSGFIVVMLSSSAALAQVATGQAANQSGALPEILVTSPTTVPTPINDVASSITVITSQQIEDHQWRTVPDALETVPGLNVVQTGGPGGLTSVFIRGTKSNDVKVLIDGIDVSDPSNTNDSFDFGQLLTSGIERIEILRGPQSGLYGSDAIGGVINIITKKGQGPLKVTGAIEGGSFGTNIERFSASGSQSIFNYAFNIAHFDSASTPVTPLNDLGPGEQRNNDAYENWTFSTKLGADINEHLTFNYVGRYTTSNLFSTSDDQFNPITGLAFPDPVQSLQDIHEFFTRGEAVTTFFDGRLKNYLGINYSDTHTLFDDPDAEIETNEGQRLKFDWRSVIAALPGETVVLGADQETETLLQNSPFTPVSNASRDDAGGYAELQSNLYDRFFLVSNVRYDDYDTFGGHATYRIAPAFIVPWTQTKLKATYGTAFKAPTLSQLYVNFPGLFPFFGNPDLKPEESTGYDAGFEQPLFHDRVSFGATYFHNNITNLIAANATDTTDINIGHAETQGVESFAEWVATDRLKLRADYTYTRAIDEATGQELLTTLTPYDKGSLTALWTPIDPLTLSGTLVAVSKWVSEFDRDNLNAAPGEFAPGYVLVNAAATYKIDDHISVFARIDNLLNEHYENPLGFLRPGIGVYGGVRLAAF
jgi:vitamin B12 transporter